MAKVRSRRIRKPLDLSQRLTLSPTEAGRALGLGRNSTYRAIKRREVPALRIGGKLHVPVEALRQKLLAAAGEQVVMPTAKPGARAVQ